MRFYNLYLLAFMFLSCSSYSGAAKEPIYLVPDFNIDRYMGTWNEIASIPASFQRKCLKNTQAKYSKSNQEGLINVVNSCDTKNGRSEANATARKIKKATFDSQLQVSFLKVFGQPIWAAGGNYWVLAVDEDYSVALVGEPKRKYAWILARGKEVSHSVLNRMVDFLELNSYKPCSLKMSIIRRHL